MYSLKGLDDRQLLEIIKDKTKDELIIEEAKELIYERYSYMAKYMLKHLRLQYSKYEEEDLIHHGYLLITNAINSYDLNYHCAFKSFLFHVLRKGMLNQFFQKDKFRNKETVMTSVCDEHDFSTIDSLNMQSQALSAYDELILSEQVDIIKSHLSESEYNCVMARYFGASYKETAKTFGYTVKQVDNKIQSVRKDKMKYVKI